jgi:hypothetical protein
VAPQGANIQTPQGVFSPSSPDLRGYFRQFDAVILCDNRADRLRQFNHQLLRLLDELERP